MKCGGLKLANNNMYIHKYTPTPTPTHTHILIINK